MTSSDWLPTACILCECNCGIVVQVDDRRLARIRGDKAHPGSAGYTCNKALRLDHYQNNRARLSSPMRRRADGTYEEIDWDTAIVEIAEGFKQIRDTHGGDKIFYYGGGGQGNHLGGAYSGAFLKALGSRYRSNALAQEKTGEAWVDFQLYGGHTRGEFENAEVSVFVGKNPWMSQSFPRARVVLNEIAKDPGRSMIVIDPVVTDTAKMADFHLRVQPGCDAWCLAALAAVLVQENLCNEAFLAAHVHGVDTVRAALQEVPVADYAQRCGVDEELLRAAARRIGTAASVSVFEDLGIQQAPNSTVCSYLNKLLWILTGNFAKKGGQHLHSSFAPLFSQVSGRTPVTGAPIIAGLIPGNVVPEEILTEHPDRFRAMIVERGNPAHSLADSAACRAAFQALELMVVVDVAMTETARLAHYVLPAASQFEKPEATFFNFEFPRNGFQLRRPLFPPLPGTLPEPEIWARLVRALGVVDEADLRPLREAAAQGRQAYTEAFLAAAATNPTVAKLTAYVLYETLGPTLPDGLAGAAALWGLAQKTAMAYPDAVRRAGHADGNALFDAILERPSGVTFTVHNYEDDFALISHPDHKIALEIPEMLAEIRSLTQTPSRLTTPQLPIVLSVGERRAYTANDIFRDPSWRKRDANGALRVSVEDAQALGLADGCLARITTAAGSAEATVEVTETMLAGHAALPNGFGLDYTGDDGRTVVAGVAPNALTSTRWRDPYAGTPWHKHVPAAIREQTQNRPFGSPNGRFCVCSRGLSLVPDPDPALRVQKQRVILGDVEGLIKSVHVANHTVAPELRRGVRIDRQPADCFGCTRFGSPYLCPAEEHPLHAGQPVDNRSGVAVQRELVSQQGDRQPAQVADVLAYGERALHMRRAGVVDEIARRVSVVLLDQRFGAGGELGAIVVGPPIDQIAVAVVFGALIVETVPDLVPDHRPDPAVVGGLVGLRIEKWWL
ncbi:Possible oxidoreductase [Mycobacterium tuberculosis]|nr:Possible oxidoreductase [Mycobacterium tuberculosis]